jgi:hypothetical protein
VTTPIYWSGSGSAPAGKTSLGIYDDDDAFFDDAPKVADWVCRRLGYPVMQVELTDGQLYDLFEEAITEYSSQVNEFNMRENMLSLQGMSTGSSVTQRLIRGSPLPHVIELSEFYGTEAGTGGNVDWKKGYIDTVAGMQEYDLNSLWGAVSESGKRIEIRRIFHDRTPAISRGGFGFGDAGTGPTDGTNNLLGEFGWAGYDGGLNGSAGGGTIGQFLIMPVYETILRAQAIEFNDMIRRSQYSFEIINNKVKFMPVPSGERIFFQYLVKEERAAAAVNTLSQDVASDYSNIPYSNIMYSNINDVGKRWIRKMTLALAKETLGRILSKYENIPSPNNEVTLDGGILRDEAAQEKDTLWEQLRESLEESGRARQMEKMAQNEEKMQDILAKVPFTIYIG